jgi:hypothetical protein
MTKCLTALVLALALSGCAAAHTTAPKLSRAKAVHRTQSATPWARQWVDTHGIAVAVPARWRLHQGQCGTPTENTVLWNNDGMTLCALPQRPGISAVEFWGILKRPAGWYHRHTTPVTIDGAKALRWDASSRWVELIFPRRGITVRVFSPHRALVRQIVASVRMVDVNKKGCPTRPDSTYRLGSRPRSGQRFIPPGATRLVGCYYDGQWLDDSSSVGSHAARRVAKALNGAKYGFSRAPRGTIARSECAPSWHAFSVAYFKYAKRPPVAVTVHPDGCTRLGASNGRWGVQMSHAWVPTFWSNVAYNGAISDVWAA